jgi:hypothetical protein
MAILERMPVFELPGRHNSAVISPGAQRASGRREGRDRTDDGGQIAPPFPS